MGNAPATLKRQLQQNNNNGESETEAVTETVTEREGGEKININILLVIMKSSGQKKVPQSTHGKKKIFLFIETDASVPGMK